MPAPILCSLARSIAVSNVQPLFSQISWAASRPPHLIQTVLDRSLCAEAWQGDRLVGFARAITDGITRAFIEDVVVDEALRGQGIGAELVTQLVAHLENVEELTLICADERVAFYERLGFERNGMNLLHIWRGG